MQKIMAVIGTRPKALEAGTTKVIGLTRYRIVQKIQKLLNDRIEYDKISKATNPYGDRKAVQRIVKVIRFV